MRVVKWRNSFAPFSTTDSSTFIYLRGIGRQEIESVLQFMYLGEATFYQDRMNDFLSVAKDLDLKEIGQNIDLTINEEDNQIIEDSTLEEKSSNNDGSFETVPVTNEIENALTTESIQRNDEDKYECNICQHQFKSVVGLLHHNRSKHEGIRYQCQICDYKATQQTHLNIHTKSKHEGIRYPCVHCDYKATTKGSLIRHTKFKH